MKRIKWKPIKWKRIKWKRINWKRTSRLLLPLAALLLAPLAGAGQASVSQAPAGQSSAGVGLAPSVSTYIATGPTTDADLARLRAALLKISGVEQVDLIPRAGGVTLRVRGTQPGTLFATAAKSVGYELRPMPVRSYLAAGPSGDADLARLREVLAKSAGVEQVDLFGSTTGATLRIRGEAAAPELAVVAKAAGFEMHPVSSYVASGPTKEADLSRLRTALGKVGGVDKLEMRGLPGGAAVVVHGDVTDAALIKTAKSTGFGLLPLSDAGGAHRFGVTGVANTEDEARLHKALHELDGGGEFHLLKTSTGMQLDVIGSMDKPDKIIAAAQAAGVALHPLEMTTSLSVDADGERITPPAPGERTLEELAKPGELAPDFTLIMKDGKGKVSLADSRGKRPVVLIFGSYT